MQFLATLTQQADTVFEGMSLGLDYAEDRLSMQLRWLASERPAAPLRELFAPVVERGTLPKATLVGLRALGHTVVENAIPLGDAKLIVLDEGGPRVWAFADAREGGLAAGAKK